MNVAGSNAFCHSARHVVMKISPDTSVWFVGGTDDYEVGRALRQLVDALCPADQQAFGLDRIDGTCSTVEEVDHAVQQTLEALRTVSFFGADKLVCLRDVNFLVPEEDPGRHEGAKEASRKLAEEIKAGLAPGVKLIVHAPRADKRTALFKACKDAGEVLAFDIPDKGYKAEQYVRDFVARRFEELGMKAGRGIPDLVVERAGTDTRQLEQEVEKLHLYCGDRPVGAEAVRAIVAPCRERMSWDLLDEYSRRDLVGALQRLRQLLFMKNEPVGLIIQLQSRIRDLKTLRIALDEGWLRLERRGNWTNTAWREAPEVDAFCSGLASDPRRMNPFRCGILAAHAAKFSVAELEDHLRLAVETHDRMLSGVAPAEVLLERFLVATVGPGEGARAA